MNKKWITGAAFALGGGLCWSVSGLTGQILMNDCNMTSDWLIPLRLFFAGIILLAFSAITGHDIFHIWKKKKNIPTLLIFGFVGLAICQYAFFTSIQYSNAAFATVMSYTTPVVIVIWNILRYKKLPKLYEVICVILVIVGAFTCVTHFDLSTFSVSPMALIWACICSVSFAFYSLAPVSLLKENDVLSITAWGLLVGSFLMIPIFRPWQVEGIHYCFELWIGLAVIVVFGTVISFTIFQFGNTIVGGLAATILSSIEPVSSVMLSILILGQKFTIYDFLGFAMILAIIPIMAMGQNHHTPALTESTDTEDR